MENTFSFHFFLKPCCWVFLVTAQSDGQLSVSLPSGCVYPCMLAFPAPFVALYFSPCARGCACLTCLVALASVLSPYVTVTFKDQTAKDKALQHMAAMSSAQIVSATAIHNKLGLPGIPRPTFPGAPGVSSQLGPAVTAASSAGVVRARAKPIHLVLVADEIRCKCSWSLTCTN